jgi:hypothetical protein
VHERVEAQRRLELAAPFEAAFLKNSPGLITRGCEFIGLSAPGTSETFLPIFSTDERGSTHGRTTGQTPDRRSEFIDVSVKLTLPSVNW